MHTAGTYICAEGLSALHSCWMEGGGEVKSGNLGSKTRNGLQEEGREFFCTTTARPAGTGTWRGSGGGGKGCCSNGIADRA